MDQDSLFPNTFFARLISIYPDKQDIYFPLEDQTNAEWRISQNPNGEILIQNISASYLQIDDTLLEINQEKKLSGGERICLDQDKDRPHYVFFPMNFKPDLKREREKMTLASEKMTKLIKIENDLLKELACSLCTNFFHKCMTLTPCQHSFCSFCLFDHIKRSSQCPLCRIEAVSVTKNPILSNVIQLVRNIFSLGQKPQERKELEEINFGGTIVRYAQSVYIGSYVNGKKDGQGKLIYQNGIIYEGSWKNDRKEGKGIMIFEDGDKYDGSWMKNCYHGIGKYSWGSGQEYEGEYIQNARNGSGTMRYEDGRVYQGNWKNDQREGNGGMLIFPSGNKYEGNWVKDVIQPKVKIEYSNGDRYEGEINVENLQRQGKGALMYKNGDQYDGNWENDKEHGKGREISRGGTRVYEGVWKKGRMSGDVTMTDDVNGKAEWRVKHSGKCGKEKRNK